MVSRPAQTFNIHKSEDYPNNEKEEKGDPMWTSQGSTLPSVCVYVGWGLCLIASLAASFFTVLYSLQWGGEKANMWLTSFILSASQSIGIISPFQVGITIGELH